MSISGAGNLHLAGEVHEQNVTVSRAGGYRAGDLRSETAGVSIPGTGHATIWVTGALDVNVTGLGNVACYGCPTVNQRITGAGELFGLDEHEDQTQESRGPAETRQRTRPLPGPQQGCATCFFPVQPRARNCVYNNRDCSRPLKEQAGKTRTRGQR